MVWQKSFQDAILGITRIPICSLPNFGPFFNRLGLFIAYIYPPCTIYKVWEFLKTLFWQRSSHGAVLGPFRRPSNYQLALFYRTLHDVFEAKKNELKRTIITELKKLDTSDTSRHFIFDTNARTIILWTNKTVWPCIKKKILWLISIDTTMI